MPWSDFFAACRRASRSSSVVAVVLISAVKSATETVGVGTRSE